VALAALIAGLLSLAAPDGVGGLPRAQAQNIGQRVVLGTVLDAGSAPVGSATSFLKDLKSKSIRSYTSTADGRFRFTQVKMAEDHELWAEKGGKKTVIKTISSWDTRTEFEVELRLK
jgi:hypothetical protein